MGRRYAVLGAGRQGIAAAYDLASFGEADDVMVADLDASTALSCADRINLLLDRKVARTVRIDIADVEESARELKGVDSVVSAVPYSYNPGITETAIRIGANMCDLGGHTETVRKQLELDERAKEAGVTIVPDCGMGPGMNISLATYAMSKLDRPREVYIWDGGLPQDPEPPWNYLCTFNIGGLTNEYFGTAVFLRDGKIAHVPCFEDLETLYFPEPLGRLEAFVTSGGLSTAPWTFLGKLERLENKTLRYPGHCAQFRAFSRLGLLEEEPISVGKNEVIPREVFHALLEREITCEEIRDIGVIRVKCIGERNGEITAVTVEMIDYFDDKLGLTAMQRITGWHASIVAILAAQGRLPKGAVPVESVAPGAIIVEEARRRGFVISEKLSHI